MQRNKLSHDMSTKFFPHGSLGNNDMLVNCDPLVYIDV